MNMVPPGVGMRTGENRALVSGMSMITASAATVIRYMTGILKGGTGHGEAKKGQEDGRKRTC